MNISFSEDIDAGLAWAWLNEFPDANFDDYGPRSEEELKAELERRRAAAEIVRVVVADGRPVGLIGYAPLTSRAGMFHGICFTRAVHRTGIAQRAVRLFLDELFSSGVEKVSASFFADNTRIDAFLRTLGAVDEGLLRKQTMRRGIPADMRLLAIFKGDLCLLADC